MSFESDSTWNKKKSEEKEKKKQPFFFYCVPLPLHLPSRSSAQGPEPAAGGGQSATAYLGPKLRPPTCRGGPKSMNDGRLFSRVATFQVDGSLALTRAAPPPHSFSPSDSSTPPHPPSFAFFFFGPISDPETSVRVRPCARRETVFVKVCVAAPLI